MLSLLSFRFRGGGGGRDFPEVEFSIVFPIGLHVFPIGLHVALRILIVGYVMLKIIMTHNLPGSKNEPQFKYQRLPFFQVLSLCAVSVTVYS